MEISMPTMALSRVIGNLLNAQLGGPCIYFGQKYRFSKVGSHRAPQIAHLKASRQWVIMLVLAWLILSIVLSSLFFRAKFIILILG